MLSVACVSVTVSSADGRRLIIPTRNLRPSGTDVSWHCYLNPCSSTVNLWLLSLRYDAISRRHIRAAFSIALQSCDELQYGDIVSRFFSAEAGTSITSHLNPISSFSTSFVDMFPRIYFRGKHVLPTEKSSSILANISSLTMLQVYLMACLCSLSISLETPSTYHKTRRMVLNSLATRYPTVSLFSTF